MKKRGGSDHEIIIKRRGKKNHHEEHGGAWKVAFADFTMAMMALFMVLWIVQPQAALNNPASGELESNPLVDGGAGVFDGTSTTPLDLGGLPVQVSPRRDRDNAARLPNDSPGPSQAEDSAEAGAVHYAGPMQMQELAQLMERLAIELDAETNLMIEVVPQGLRILIKDDQQRFMFARGSARLDPHFAKLLGVLGGVLGKVENKLIISGHTDATPYRASNGYDNWNLSGDRALRARNVLVENGLPAVNVLQVAAQADVMPLRPEAPDNGANRRIELLLLTEQAQQLYRELFGDGQLQVQVSAGGAQLLPAAAKDSTGG